MADTYKLDMDFFSISDYLAAMEIIDSCDVLIIDYCLVTRIPDPKLYKCTLLISCSFDFSKSDYLEDVKHYVWNNLYCEEV